MSYREFYSLSAEERAAHEAKWGTSNDFPTGWRKITAEEFANSQFFHYAPDLVEYRQMLPRDDKRLKKMHPYAICTHVYFMWDGTGFALLNDQRKGTVDFYAFGCDHTYIPDRNFRPQFRCNHGYICTKCGHTYNVDSGD